MSLSHRVVKDHACGGISAYASEWNEELPSLMRNQVGRVVLKNLRGQYHVDMNLYYLIILCISYGRQF